MESGQLNEETRSIRFPVVSDNSVEIWRGYHEILSHKKGALRMGERQKSLPLLFNLDWDRLLGVVDAIEQDEQRTYVTVRFAKTEEGDKALELVRDHVLVNVSCGYRIYTYENSGENERTVTDWEILEVSLVSVPADPSVGVYRSAMNNHIEQKEQEMPEEKKDDVQKPVQVVDEQQVRMAERNRINEIEAMCRNFHMDDNFRNQLISEGRTIDQARALILDQLKNRQETPAADSSRGMKADIGLTETEKHRYSLIRALMLQSPETGKRPVSNEKFLKL